MLEVCLLGTGGNIPTLEPDKIYYYMVENYPIDDGAQDPTAQPDWDGDGRQGGFVTSISNPAPISNDPSGSVGYEWKLWTVQDAHSNNVWTLEDYQAVGIDEIIKATDRS